MRLVLAAVILLAFSAFADAIDVAVTNKVMRGKGWPTVQVHILEPIAGFKLSLVRDDGTKFERKGGGKPGVIRYIELDHPEGVAHWKGELTLNYPNGSTGSMPLEFDTEIIGPLQLTIDKDKDVDVEGRKIRFKLNHPAGKVQLRVLMDTGAYAFDGDIPFDKEPAGTRLEVAWPEKPGQVMRIDFRAYDTSGLFNGVEFTPWRIDIPHEEVNFDSGKWDIRDDERAKLDASYKLIDDAVTKFGRLAQIRLYVAGHTDTVGPKDSNLTLSLNRARSIGGYFRKKGLSIPVYYAGFGEDALLVGTPDETDELKNRRAQYIISIDDPTMTNVPFAAKWKRL